MVICRCAGSFWPAEHTARCLCKLSGIFFIPMGIFFYDLSVPTKTIFSRYPDAQHSVKHTYASIIRVNREILMHTYQMSAGNSDASENENNIHEEKELNCVRGSFGK